MGPSKPQNQSVKKLYMMRVPETERLRLLFYLKLVLLNGVSCKQSDNRLSAKNSEIVKEQTLQVARRKCIAKDCFKVQKTFWGRSTVFRGSFIPVVFGQCCYQSFRVNSLSRDQLQVLVAGPTCRPIVCADPKHLPCRLTGLGYLSQYPTDESVTENLRYFPFVPNLDSGMISSLANCRPFSALFVICRPQESFCQVS